MAGDDAPQVSIADGTHSIVQDDTTNMVRITSYH